MALRIVAHIFILTRGAAGVPGRLRALQPVSIRGALYSAGAVKTGVAL